MAINSDGSSTFFPLPQAGYDKCLHIVRTAQSTWTELVAEFAAENLAMGITQNQSVKVGQALNQVMVYGAEGSLWLAFDALSQVVITPDLAPFVTAARIQWMKNKLIDVVSRIQ